MTTASLTSLQRLPFSDKLRLQELYMNIWMHSNNYALGSHFVVLCCGCIVSHVTHVLQGYIIKALKQPKLVWVNTWMHWEHTEDLSHLIYSLCNCNKNKVQVNHMYISWDTMHTVVPHNIQNIFGINDIVIYYQYYVFPTFIGITRSIIYIHEWLAHRK